MVVSHGLRVLAATAKVNLIMSWRFFSWTGFALRFWTPILSLAAAWVLYNQVYEGVTSTEFGIAAGGSGYLSFIVVGNAFYVFVFAAAFVVGRVMFWERANGTIEATFMTPMNRLTYMAGVMMAASINSSVDLTAVFLIGILFGFQVTSFNAVLFLVGLLLTAFALFGIGLMANAITLSFRDRTTTSNSLMLLFLVFGGIVCPVELMPTWAQMISKALPLTYGIRVIRASLHGISVQDAFCDLAVLFVLGVIFVGAGALTLRLIERNLKKKALFSVF